jgi:tetratricopeptide (TPR) repeat protein
MARYSFTLTVVSVLSLLAGCGPSYEGAGQMAPPNALNPTVAAQVQDTGAATEAELVEQIALSRQNYKQGLEKLVDFYTKNGNNMKLNWANAELDALNKNPQYRFVIQAEAAGADLRAMNLEAGADVLYRDGMAYFNEGKPLVGFPNDGKLRMALERFNQLIAQYPNSDKIDDAAYAAGQIYEYFKDYSIAAMYYTRTFEWDKNTPHPAMFKAAYIYDRHLTNREKALDLYKRYLATKPSIQGYKEYAETRVAQIMKEQPMLPAQPMQPSVPPLP